METESFIIRELKKKIYKAENLVQWHSIWLAYVRP